MKCEGLLFIIVLLAILLVVSVVINFKLKNKNNVREFKIHYLNSEIRTLNHLVKVLKEKI